MCRGVIDEHAVFLHHFFNVAKVQRIVHSLDHLEQGIYHCHNQKFWQAPRLAKSAYRNRT
jgi:hypothetical protein